MRGIVRRSSHPEEIWYTDGSSVVLDSKRRAGYAVVSNFETIETKPLPPVTSAQLAKLIALTRALELGKGKRIAIYIDSKYTFVVIHAHTAIWKEGGHLTTQGSPVKYGDQTLRLLEAVICSLRFQSPTVKGTKLGAWKWHEGTKQLSRQLREQRYRSDL